MKECGKHSSGALKEAHNTETRYRTLLSLAKILLVILAIKKKTEIILKLAFPPS